MRNLAIHPHTKTQLDNYLQSPAHALLLVGPTGSGKQSLAEALAAQVLDIATIVDHPYSLSVSSEDGKAISIESVRKLEQFLRNKVPGSKPFDRAVVINDAHTMGHEAQNALLKTLEEPPAGTIIILSANHAQALLPTIRSRVQTIDVHTPDKADLQQAFTDSNPAAFTKAYAITGGLPGLMHALLNATDHPLLKATEQARELLGANVYERLAKVDAFSKQRTEAIDVAFILQQMAHVSLQKATGPAAQRWQNILTASYEAAESLSQNGQPKLTLTKLMLSM